MRTNEAAYLTAVLIVSVCSTVARAQELRAKSLNILQTTTGIRFGILGQKGPTPEPTMFLFSDTIEGSLRGDAALGIVAQILGEQGYLCVSLDLPGHGRDVRAGEPTNGLSGWRQRLERGENFVPDFVTKVSAVLDFLIQGGYTNPQKIAACGNSRGGFMALQFTAGEPRVRCVCAVAPVTNLIALREFSGIEADPAAWALAGSLSLASNAEKLANRPIWVSIGNDDQRVNTDDAIAFTRIVVELSRAKRYPADVQLHVMPNPDHTVPPHAPEEAAAWVLQHVGN